MKTKWFRQWGWLYVPVHPMGFLLTLLTILFLLLLYGGIARSGRPVRDDLYQVFICTTCAVFWWKWIAQKTSSP